VPQLLEDQWVLIGGFGDLNQPSYHGGLPSVARSTAILDERIARVVALPQRDHPSISDISSKSRVRLEICEGSKRSLTGPVRSKGAKPGVVLLQPRAARSIAFGLSAKSAYRAAVRRQITVQL
jgi:hypothetical protein